jgi:hypothetical protein
MSRPLDPSVTSDVTRVALGGHRTLSFAVQNASSVAERYRVDVRGVPTDWYSLDKTALTLQPNASEEIRLVVHPPDDPPTLAGRYLISLEVTAEEDATQRVSDTILLDVHAADGLSMHLQPTDCAGQSATFEITLLNRSAARVEVPILLRGEDPSFAYRVEPQDPVAVPGAATQSVTVHVVPAVRTLIGKPHTYELEFRCQPHGAGSDANPPLVRHARFTYVPRFAVPSMSRDMRPVGLAVLPLLAILLLLVLTFGSHPATPSGRSPLRASMSMLLLPQIERFAVQVQPGGAPEVVWAVAGARDVRLITLGSGDARTVAPRGRRALPAIAAPVTLVLSAANQAGRVAQPLKILPLGAAQHAPRSAP